MWQLSLFPELADKISSRHRSPFQRMDRVPGTHGDKTCIQVRNCGLAPIKVLRLCRLPKQADALINRQYPTNYQPHTRATPMPSCPFLSPCLRVSVSPCLRVSVSPCVSLSLSVSLCIKTVSEISSECVSE